MKFLKRVRGRRMIIKRCSRRLRLWNWCNLSRRDDSFPLLASYFLMCDCQDEVRCSSIATKRMHTRATFSYFPLPKDIAIAATWLNIRQDFSVKMHSAYYWFISKTPTVSELKIKITKVCVFFIVAFRAQESSPRFLVYNFKIHKYKIITHSEASRSRFFLVWYCFTMVHC